VCVGVHVCVHVCVHRNGVRGKWLREGCGITVLGGAIKLLSSYSNKL